MKLQHKIIILSITLSVFMLLLQTTINLTNIKKNKPLKKIEYVYNNVHLPNTLAKIPHIMPKYTPPSVKMIYIAYGGKVPHNLLNLISLRTIIPDSKIKLFVSYGNKNMTLERFAFIGNIEVIECLDLKGFYAVTRFYCYFKEIQKEQNNTKIGIIDAGDVWFQKNIFELIKNGIYFAAEPAHHPIRVCHAHKKWILNCPSYGTTVWNEVKNNSMICAGTIWGVMTYVKDFLEIFTKELKKTGCNDQGVLNVLIYTNIFEHIPKHIWPHENEIVLSMNIAKSFKHDKAYVIHTGDGWRGRKAINHIKKASQKAIELPDAGCKIPTETVPIKVRSKPLLSIHLSHGGGAFVASVAKQNGEILFGGGFSTCNGDLPRKPTIIRTCLQRALEVHRFGVTFQQIERGFESSEFCPTVYDHVLFLRNPIKRMDSHLSKWLKTPEKIENLLLLLQIKGKPLDYGPKSEWHKMLHLPNTDSYEHGHGLMNFDNLLTRWLTGDSYWLHTPIGTVNETTFEIATKNLAQFKLAIPLSEMETVVHQLGWNYTEKKDKHKHKLNHHAKGRLDSVQKETLKQLNKWDYKLWDCVRNRQTTYGCPNSF